MKKIKFFINLENEVAWLNEMSKHGFELVNVSFLNVYTFEKSSVIYNYFIDLPINKIQDATKKIEATHIANLGNRVYYKKNGVFDHNIDQDNSTVYYKKLSQIFMFTILFYAISIIFQIGLLSNSTFPYPQYIVIAIMLILIFISIKLILNIYKIIGNNIVKFKLFLDKDKEEKWLNELAKNHLALESFIIGFYFFKKSDVIWEYKVDIYRKSLGNRDDYIKFIEDTGAQLVLNYGFWMIFKRDSSFGEFELYTDTKSQLQQYNAIRNAFTIVLLIELFAIGINLIHNDIYYHKDRLIIISLLMLFVIALLYVIFKTQTIINRIKNKI